MINYGGIPFELKRKQPNETTIKAMMELEQGQGIKTANTKTLMEEHDVSLENA